MIKNVYFYCINLNVHFVELAIMENQPKLLISVYKSEKKLLQKLINECLKEMDYLGAHYHMEALTMLNRKIQILNNIDDPNYHIKKWIEHSINTSLKRMKHEKHDAMKALYEHEILDGKQQLEKLNYTSPRNRQADATLLFDVLEKLMNKKAKNVKLYLKKSDNLYLSFTYSKQTLNVTLPQVQKLTKAWILHNENIINFKNLGFNFDDNETKLILPLTGSSNHILGSLKTILSKIIFEVFNFPEFKNESYLQYTEK